MKRKSKGTLKVCALDGAKLQDSAATSDIVADNNNGMNVAMVIIDEERNVDGEDGEDEGNGGEEISTSDTNECDEIYNIAKRVKDATVEYDDQGGMLMKSVFDQGPKVSYRRQEPHAAFACTEKGCKKKYRKKQSLNYHLEVQHFRRHVCEICSRSCVNKDRLVKHKSKVHSPSVTKRSEESSINTVHCRICSERSFKSKMKCKEHCAVVHMGKRYQCEIKGCKKILKTSKDYYNHKQTHIKRNVCNIDECGAKFSLPYQLKNHMKQKHLNIELFVCQFCSKSLASKSCVVRHERRYCKKNTEEQPNRNCDYGSDSEDDYFASLPYIIQGGELKISSA